MNIIRRLQDHQSESRKRLETQKRLSAIPESRLVGINALPTELWRQILEYALLDEELELKFHNYELHKLLELRLVCRAFEEEVRGILKRRIAMAQIPRHTFLRNIYALIDQEETRFNLRNELLASALFNSTRCRSRYSFQYTIMSRIKNCVVIAQHISSNFTPEHQQELLRRFCIAASTSRSCWSYIFMLRYNEDGFVELVDKSGVSIRSSDLRLEMALLIANEYKLEDVKEWMIRLGKARQLVGYRCDRVIIGKPWIWEYGDCKDHGTEICNMPCFG